MYYAYVLRSDQFDQYYYGSTSDIKARIKSHNAGESKHTSKYKPWHIVWYAAFKDKTNAEAFEVYLKTASGKAFFRKRLI